MKIKTSQVIRRLNGKLLMVDQEPLIGPDGQPALMDGRPLLGGGREMTIGDVISSILTTKKVDQFNPLKAYALAQRFYRAEVTDLDDSDHGSMREIVEKRDQFIPLVLAQVLQSLADAKDGMVKSNKKS
jgi:hypothetical protein